jgi:putative ABC transport system permease protein
MSLWSRIANALHGNRLNSEIDEELHSHIEEAIEHGRDPSEARRAFGSPLRQREETRDVQVIAWLDSLRADAVFGWRQIAKRKVTSAAAILSLALAIGACTSAFRLIDALLLRPLPVTGPEHLYALSHQAVLDGKPSAFDRWAYPNFRLMRAAVKDQAELIAISYAERMDLTYKSDHEMEKAYLQYVSGWMFSSFGLRPTLGRLLTEDDDLKPRTHPYAVLSHDYWTRRFARGPERDRSHLPYGRDNLRNRRSRRPIVHRHRTGNRNRHLCTHHDAPGRGSRRLAMAPDLGANEARYSHRTRSPKNGRHQPGR